MMKHWKKFLVGLAVILGFQLMSWVGYRLLAEKTLLEQRALPGASGVLEPLGESLSLACFNIAHGRGLASSNWKGSKQERKERLESIAALLRQVDADVVVLNEVDFQATWSSGVNQAEFLAKQAGYPYWVEQRNLDLWSFFLTLRFGNAVLSRFPIQEADLLEYPGSTWLERLGGYRKRGVVASLQAGEQSFRVAAIHFSHLSREAAADSAAMLLGLPELPESPLFLAGDFNATPDVLYPSGYDPMAAPNAMRLLDASQRFRRIPLESAQDTDWTFVNSDYKFVIDWILIPPSWEFQSHRVHQDGEEPALRLSDHRLVTAEVALSVVPGKQPTEDSRPQE